MSFRGFGKCRIPTAGWKLAAVLLNLALLVPAVADASAARRERDDAARQRSRFALADHNAFLTLFGNRVQCGINNAGEICVDVFDSPTGGGGFWPGGTLNQYIFNSGMQVAGIIDPNDPNNPWAGDTTGAFIFDPKGTEIHGDVRGGQFVAIWNSLEPRDLETWPAEAIVSDPEIFSDLLIGRRSVSQQDSWLRYWEGNPALIAGRPHPLGLEFDTRSMLWNFPSGNEDILYFVFTFRNISNDPEFQTLNENRFGVDLPDDGWTITDMFAAFAMDPDVGDDAGSNLTNAFLEFQMGVALDADFQQPSPPFVFPPEIHGPPFFNSTGFIGVKYLKSPTDPATGEDVGLRLYTQTTNPSQAGGFKDATGVKQLYRYLSGNINTALGDDPCSIPQSEVLTEKICFVGNTPTDVRFVQSAGPFDLAPGEEATIVVAYIHAAPVAVPEYSQGNNLLPNTLPNVDSVRTLDRMMGYVGAQGSAKVDTTGTGLRFEDLVPTVSRSLLDKAKVAQAVFDAKFLVPFSPEPPRLTLVPGDGRVTVVWDPSPTETEGDPFAAVALDETNALCDLNYRQFDVEGYRIYRGTSGADLQVIAQFDKVGTTIPDVTGRFDQDQLDPPDDCTRVNDPPVEHDLTGRLVQFPPGGRVELADGSVIPIGADTTPASQFPPLEDTGVPFAFVDNTVVNGFRYVYAVTAFDYNSIKSGPASLESPRAPQSVIPRKGATNQTLGSLSFTMTGDDGLELDPNASLPAFDRNTQIFSGPQPPTNGIEFAFAGFVSEVAPPSGSLNLTIDSILPGSPFQHVEGGGPEMPATYYVTIDTKTGPIQTTIPLLVDYYDSPVLKESVYPAVAAVDSAARLYGADSTLTLFEKVVIQHPGNWRTTAFGRGAVNNSPSRSKFTGVRWFEGANETLPEPYAGYCADALNADPALNCTTPASVDANRTGGQLPGVDALYSLQGYNSVPSTIREMEGVFSTVWRAADIEFVWGAGGTVQRVRDLTHHVDVPFSPKIRASWGFLTSASFAGVDPLSTPDDRNDVITHSDFTCVDPIPSFGFRPGTYCSTPVDLQQTAQLDDVVAAASSFSGTATATVTGQGFGLYINGRTFIFQMSQLPDAGTRWVLRTYAGPIRHSSACGSPCLASDPGRLPYTWVPSLRPPAVPGLNLTLNFTGATVAPTVPAAVANVHPVPNPYYATSAFEISPASKIIRFVNLPTRATIRIYSLSGILVSIIDHDDPTASGEAVWNVRNLNNQFVASGVYFFHVVTPDGQEKLGRMVVVNFAQ